MTCDFTYTEPVGEVEGYIFNHVTNKLTLEGINFPNVTADISSIFFAHTHCTIDESSLTSTLLECTLDDTPVCGDYLPIFTSTLGVVPNAVGLISEEVVCTLSYVTPSEKLNLLGGDNLTFTGTFLPRDLSTSTVSIKFSDAQQTECIPQTSQTDKLVCLTNAFDKSLSADAQFTFEVVINNKTATESLSVTSRDTSAQGINLNPSSVSPVLKTPIEIQIDTNFPYTLNKEDFSVNATSLTNSTYMRYLNVIRVNDTAKTITVMFGGSISIYSPLQIQIRHVLTGLIESTGLILDVNTYVDSYSPKIGSIYGGTLLTVTGRNFGTIITDNPIQISTNGGVDSIDCYL